jgi:hypothetical protein
MTPGNLQLAILIGLGCQLDICQLTVNMSLARSMISNTWTITDTHVMHAAQEVTVASEVVGRHGCLTVINDGRVRVLQPQAV